MMNSRGEVRHCTTALIVLPLAFCLPSLAACDEVNGKREAEKSVRAVSEACGQE